MGDCDPTKGSGEFLAMGNALLDMTFFADKAFVDAQDLKVNGACMIDNCDRFMTILDGLEARFHASGHVPGGSGQNVARTVQWLMPSGPGTATYLGAACTDRIGTLLLDKARHSGINALYQVVDDPTGCCLVIVTGEHNENRSLVAHLGGAKSFSVDHLKANWAAVEKARLFYIEGFFLPTCFDACMAVAKHVGGAEKKYLALHLSATYIASGQKDKILEIMPFVDTIFGNQQEFIAFGNAAGLGNDPMTIVNGIACMPKAKADKRLVIMTNSQNPVVAVSGCCGKAEAPVTCEVTKLSGDRFVDRNGAGDAFVGGVMAQMLRGKPLDQCLRCGIKAAEITIQHFGCTFPAEKPNLDKLCE